LQLARAPEVHRHVRAHVPDFSLLLQNTRRAHRHEREAHTVHAKPLSAPTLGTGLRHVPVTSAARVRVSLAAGTAHSRHGAGICITVICVSSCARQRWRCQTAWACCEPVARRRRWPAGTGTDLTKFRSRALIVYQMAHTHTGAAARAAARGSRSRSSQWFMADERAAAGRSSFSPVPISARALHLSLVVIAAANSSTLAQAIVLPGCPPVDVVPVAIQGGGYVRTAGV
jgi:hypothetical protein